MRGMRATAPVTWDSLLWWCDHAPKARALRFKVDSLGRRMFAWQCLKCGGHATEKKWVRVSVEEQASAKPWDKSLEEQWAEERRTIREKWDSTDDYKFQPLRRPDGYEEHLRSDIWKDIRERVIRRSGGRCEGCGLRPGVHVHHLTYAHFGDELLFELQHVCVECHEKIHPHMKGSAP